MTTTATAIPTPGDLGLEHDGALALYDELLTLPTDARRIRAGQALAQRRADLHLYRALLIERDGMAPAITVIIAGDELLAEYAVLATL